MQHCNAKKKMSSPGRQKPCPKYGRADERPNATQAPQLMDSQQMQEWPNRMDEYGWEFVGYGATPLAGL
jgi:hypothetical protein